jgi:hypothetical protein
VVQFVAVLLVVLGEGLVVRAEEDQEEEGDGVEKTKRFPPPPLWMLRWSSTTLMERLQKLS